MLQNKLDTTEEEVRKEKKRNSSGEEGNYNLSPDLICKG